MNPMDPYSPPWPIQVPMALSPPPLLLLTDLLLLCHGSIEHCPRSTEYCLDCIETFSSCAPDRLVTVQSLPLSRLGMAESQPGAYPGVLRVPGGWKYVGAGVTAAMGVIRGLPCHMCLSQAVGKAVPEAVCPYLHGQLKAWAAPRVCMASQQ